jgi:multiple sugar transport system substrate-binding protein
MNEKKFHGLTWDHPRGYNALAAAAEASGGLVQWDKQPLEGFETHPIGELAARYDLVVLDHPHIGEAVALDCLRPLEDLFSPEEIAAWAAQSIGAAMRSYYWSGKHWALPLDVATQVAVYRPDRITSVPDNWDDVVRLAERAPIAIAVAGPHAALHFLALCVALGEEPGGDDLVSDPVATEALRVMQRLYRHASRRLLDLNPIGLHAAMASEDEVALAPLVYGYADYANPIAGGHALAFAEAPAGPSGRRGSVLGGTGIALSRRVEPGLTLLDHLRYLMREETQINFIPAHRGQPSARAAWGDRRVNARYGNAYASTLATTEQAWVRPRFDGWIALQAKVASLIRAFLESGGSPERTIATLHTEWSRARERARGRLE